MNEVKVWQENGIHTMLYPDKYEQLDNGPTATTVRFGMWHIAVKVLNCLCPDGKRRTARITGQADTWFSTPASVKYRGKTVSGWITGENEDTVFHPYYYLAHGNLFPRAAYCTYEVWDKDKDEPRAQRRAYAKPVRLFWCVSRHGVWFPLGDCDECSPYRHAVANLKDKDGKYGEYNHNLSCYRCQVTENTFLALRYAVPMLGVALLPGCNVRLYDNDTRTDEDREREMARHNAFIGYAQEHNVLMPKNDYLALVDKE